MEVGLRGVAYGKQERARWAHKGQEAYVEIILEFGMRASCLEEDAGLPLWHGKNRSSHGRADVLGEGWAHGRFSLLPISDEPETKYCPPRVRRVL